MKSLSLLAATNLVLFKVEFLCSCVAICLASLWSLLRRRAGSVGNQRLFCISFMCSLNGASISKRCRRNDSFEICNRRFLSACFVLTACSYSVVGDFYKAIWSYDVQLRWNALCFKCRSVKHINLWFLLMPLHLLKIKETGGSHL